MLQHDYQGTAHGKQPVNEVSDNEYNRVQWVKEKHLEKQKQQQQQKQQRNQIAGIVTLTRG